MEVGAEHLAQLAQALHADLTIDIVTTGARSGRQRRVEIWFTNVDGRIIITGTVTGGRGEPVLPRDWLANLAATPEFLFCFKESIVAELPARATVVRDPRLRRVFMTAPETQWYREQGDTVEELIASAPLVEVQFLGDFTPLNQAAM